MLAIRNNAARMYWYTNTSSKTNWNEKVIPNQLKK